MRVLLDCSARRVNLLYSRHPDWVAGQLITPLTSYRVGNGLFAVDNGAFSGFSESKFLRLLGRSRHASSRCLFVASPDVVGNALATLALFEAWRDRLAGWPIALVAQDGVEDLAIPWESITAVFVGGSTAWKESITARDLCRESRRQGKWVHVGRVNTPRRWALFEAIADTCDGSGVARYDWMLERIVNKGDIPLLGTAKGGDE